MQDLRDAVVTALIEQQRAGADLSVMVADSTSTSKIAPFEQAYPERVVNVGIAEQTWWAWPPAWRSAAARSLPPTRHPSCSLALTNR